LHVPELPILLCGLTRKLRTVLLGDLRNFAISWIVAISLGMKQVKPNFLSKFIASTLHLFPM
jgi:hypothetical protein